jgi:hypothetical protein
MASLLNLGNFSLEFTSNNEETNKNVRGALKSIKDGDDKWELRLENFATHGQITRYCTNLNVMYHVADHISSITYDCDWSEEIESKLIRFLKDIIGEDDDEEAKLTFGGLTFGFTINNDKTTKIFKNALESIKSGKPSWYIDNSTVECNSTIKRDGSKFEIYYYIEGHISEITYVCEWDEEVEAKMINFIENALSKV